LPPAKALSFVRRRSAARSPLPRGPWRSGGHVGSRPSWRRLSQAGRLVHPAKSSGRTELARLHAVAGTAALAPVQYLHNAAGGLAQDGVAKEESFCAHNLMCLYNKEIANINNLSWVGRYIILLLYTPREKGAEAGQNRRSPGRYFCTLPRWARRRRSNKKARRLKAMVPE